MNADFVNFILITVIMVFVTVFYFWFNYHWDQNELKVKIFCNENGYYLYRYVSTGFFDSASCGKIIGNTIEWIDVQEYENSYYLRRN